MRYELKRWKERYTDLLPAYANDPLIARNMPDGFPSPFTYDDARRFIERRQLAGERQEYARAIIIGDEVAGSVLITVGEGARACCGTLEFWLGEPFRERGIMSAALRQACAEAFGELGVARIQAEVTASNKAARGALNNADFTLEGILRGSILTDGEPADTCVYGLLNDGGYNSFSSEG